MTDKTTLTLIPGGATADQMAESNRKLEQNLTELVKYQGTLAKLRRASYEANLKQGFTEAQALHLCQFIR